MWCCVNDRSQEKVDTTGLGEQNKIVRASTRTDSRSLLEQQQKSPDEQVRKKQTLLGLEVHSVTEEQRAHLRVIFTTLDTDSSGQITLAELTQYNESTLPETGYLAGLFESMNEQVVLGNHCRDGRVTLDEFMAYWESEVGKEGFERVKNATLELTKGHLLTKEQIHGAHPCKRDAMKPQDKQGGNDTLAVMMTPGWKCTAVNLYKDIDKDEDGKLTKEEFVTWAQQNQQKAKVMLPVLEPSDGFDNLLFQFDKSDGENMSADMVFSQDEFVVMYVNLMKGSMMQSDNPQIVPTAVRDDDMSAFTV